MENSPCAWERREEHPGRQGWNEWRLEAWTKANAFERGLIVEASWNTGCVWLGGTKDETTEVDGRD